MARARGGGLGLRMALLCVSIAHGAFAQSEPSGPTMALNFDAPQECEARAAFIARVRNYTTKAQFTDDASVRLFAISIARGPDALIGNLEIVSAEERATRTVSGKTCPELLDALALMTALAIDPDALAAPQPSPPPEKKPEPKPRAQPPRSRPTMTSKDSVQWSLGARGIGVLGVLPKLAYGAGVLGELRTRTKASLRATFDLGVDYFTHGDHASGPLTVDYAVLGVHAQACTELGVAQSLRPALCGLGLFGRIRARTEAPAEALGSGSRQWLGIALVPRVDLELAAALALRLEAGAGLHAIEHEVRVRTIEPDASTSEAVIHRVDGWFGIAGIGLLLHL